MKEVDDSVVHLTLSDCICALVLTIIGFFTRYWIIWNPPSTVFDEVYFGNFTNYYISKEFYNDIHPPLAKIIMYYIAKTGEYDGKLIFGGPPYTQPDYVLLRITPATFSALCVPMVFLSARFLGFSTAPAFCAGWMCAFETSMIAEGRHILTDGILHFFSIFHITVLSYSLNFRSKKRDSFWIWHIFNGITLGMACSCKNTAWGLMGMDAIAYFYFLWPSLKNGFLVYAFDVFVYGVTLFLINFVVFIGTYALHFILLPFDGTGTPYLNQEMKNQLVPPGNSSLLRLRLQPPSLFRRSVTYIINTHKGNMGITQFHDSMSFPYNWPILSGVAVFFFYDAGKEIRCLGNVFVYYCALFGIIMCLFPFKSRKRWSSWILAAGYSFCYFPFYLIPRVMYQYHYIIPLMIAIVGYSAFLDIYLPNKYKGILVVLTCFFVLYGWWLWKNIIYALPPKEMDIILWTRNWVDGDERHKRDKSIDMAKPK